MKYINFGIYTKEDNLIIVLEPTNPDYLAMVRFDKNTNNLFDFRDNLESFQNKEINRVLMMRFTKIKDYQISFMNIKQFPDYLKTWAYVGVIEDKIQKYFKSHIKGLLPNGEIYFRSN